MGAPTIAPCLLCGRGRNIYNVNTDWVTHRSPACSLDNKTMTTYEWNSTNRPRIECDERDPDEVAEERAERKRIAMEMDGPHEEAP